MQTIIKWQAYLFDPHQLHLKVPYAQMKFLILTLLFSLSGCVSNSINQKSLSLLNIEKLKVGFSTKTDVLSALGNPALKVIIRAEDTFEAWSYFDGEPQPTPRLALHFDSKSQVLRSITWFISKNENEANIDAAMNRYPNSNFRVYNPASLNKHHRKSVV
jgi:outer membrane protein assembly factor BamE (lipoprotein component of BamABCDE complex)